MQSTFLTENASLLMNKIPGIVCLGFISQTPPTFRLERNRKK